MEALRSPKDVAADASASAANFFQANRSLPAPPTLGDLNATEVKLARLHNDVFYQARHSGLAFSSKEREVQSKSFVGRALYDVIREGTANDKDESTHVQLETSQSATSSGAMGGLSIHQSMPGHRAEDALSHLIFPRSVQRPKPLWHPKWKLKTVIAGHTGWVRCLDVDPTNEWFVSGGNDRLIKIWDLASGTLKLSLTGHIHNVRCVAVSSKHPYLFSCGEDNTVKCWDLEMNKVVRHYHGHLSGVYSLTIHPTLDVIASGGRDSAVRVWDIRTREQIHCLSGHRSTVFSLASQAIEPQLISGAADATVRTWDLRAGRCDTVLTHHSKCIRALAVHPREYTFLSGGGDALKIWKGAHATYERELDPCKSIVNAIAIKDDPQSSVVIAGSDSGFLHFWDWQSGRRYQTLETQPQPGSLASENAIFAVKLDRSETRLLTAEGDKSIKIWQEDTNIDYEEDNEDIKLSIE